jgi:hypothetical protein
MLMANQRSSVVSRRKEYTKMADIKINGNDWNRISDEAKQQIVAILRGSRLMEDADDIIPDMSVPSVSTADGMSEADCRAVSDALLAAFSVDFLVPLKLSQRVRKAICKGLAGVGAAACALLKNPQERELCIAAVMAGASVCDAAASSRP